MKEFLGGLEKIVQLIKQEGGIDRATLVMELCQLMNMSSKAHNEKRASLMFISHQIVADIEELISADTARGVSPFEGEYVWPGYGGRQGFIAIDHDSLLGRSCKGAGYTSWNEKHSPEIFLEVCRKLVESVEATLTPFDLDLLGLEKIGSDRVRVKLTGRVVSLNDMEHMLCKIYLACARSRGSRNRGVARPWRNFCWPPKRVDTVGCIYMENIISGTIIGEFEKAVSAMLVGSGSASPLCPLEHPFLDV
jgi:hypothetical protein